MKLLRYAFLGTLLACGLRASPAVAQEPEYEPSWPVVIDAFEVKGLWRTKGFVVARELPWKPGELVPQDAWELGTQRLWNLGIFSRVNARLVRRGSRTVALIDVEERWTVNLMLRFQVSGDGSYWIRVGAYDINNFGHYIEAGGFYERYDTHNGGEVWVRNPRLFDLRLDGMFTAYQLARPRPTYADVRTGARIDLVSEAAHTIHYGGWIEGMWDTFLRVPRVAPPTLPVGKTLQFGPMARIGAVDIVRLRPTGWSLEIRPSLSIDLSRRNAAFGGVFMEGLWYRMVGQRWTFALRSQLAFQTNSDPEYHYFIGGLDYIRGVPDNFIETQVYALLNFEARFIAFDSTWFAVQPAVFVNGVIARGLTPRAIGALSVGAGVRLLVPRLVHSGLRIDAAFPLAPLLKPSLATLNIGVYQYF